MLKIEDFRQEYKTQKPIKSYRAGCIEAVHISKGINATFLSDKKFYFPMGAFHNDKIKFVGFFDKPPEGFNGKSYKIYRLRRQNNSISTFIPIPTELKPILGLSKNKKPLLSYSLGFTKQGLVMVIEKWG